MTTRPTGVRRVLRSRWARGIPLIGVVTLVATGLVSPTPNAHAVVNAQTMTLTTDVAKVGLERTLHSDRPTEMVGFDWDGLSTGTLELRTRQGSTWGPWQAVESDPNEGPDLNSREHHDRTSAGPVWVGHDRRDFQVRVTGGELRNLRVHAIRSEETTGSNPLALKPAGADPAYPNIISRAGWGADESWRTCNPDYASTVRYGIVHHTDTGNGYASGDVPSIIRGIYYFHTHTNGWCDIGYNFLVDAFGRVWEGRWGGIDKAVIGAHAGGFNTGSTGVAAIGTFDSVAPSRGIYDALRSVLAWKLALHGVDPGGTSTVTAGEFDGSKYPTGAQVTVNNISGHRDVDQTGCPGDLAYNLLPQLRSDVRTDVFSSARWHQWTSNGGSVTASPAVASWGPGRVDLFVKGGDNNIWHQWWDGQGWHPFEGLGAPTIGIASAPTAAAWGFNRLDLFVQGKDGNLWHKWNAGSWSGWENLGKPVAGPLSGLSSAPTVASWAAGRLDVFANGPGGNLWHKWYAGGWSGWENLGGGLSAAPGAVSWASGRIDVFVRGNDNHLWHKWYAGGWSGFEGLGGGLAGAPAAASWASGRLDVFVRGNDNAVWHIFYGGKWSGFEGLGGGLAADPGAASWGTNRIDVFVRGNDNQAWHQWWA